MKYLKLSTFLILTQGILSLSCKKFVELDTPKTQLTKNSVFADNATATAAVLSIYASMEKAVAYTTPFYTGLSSDELIDVSNNNINSEFYKNSLTPTNSAISTFWDGAYNFIYNANSVIEGLAKSKDVSESVKIQLTGESKFIRAFWLFYLTNLYGDVPLTITTDYLINATSSRTPKSEVSQQIISDLLEAQSLLSDNYVRADNSNYSIVSAERVRPNKWVATALLARVYLHMQEWSKAENQANAVINNNSMFNIVSDLSKVFLKNSPEAIWQLMPVSNSTNTVEGSQFIATSTPAVSLSPELLNSFELNDIRKTEWVNKITVGSSTYYYPFKYKIKSIVPGTPYQEYSMVLRLGEQYLIRAEARAQQNKLNDAQIDLNIIRKRAGLSDTAAINQSSLLFAIEHERQVELFSEWGIRWLDLKRTNRADAVLGPIKGSTWQQTDVLYPIPFSDISTNSNITQNLGY